VYSTVLTKKQKAAKLEPAVLAHVVVDSPALFVELSSVNATTLKVVSREN
jgi:hypothetical protein